MFRVILIGLAVALMSMSACRRNAPQEGRASSDAPAAPSNRVDIPAMVRQNLGITFARVERRVMSRTLRVPGRFELLPTARREYVAAIPGRVELLVSQFDRVEVGTPLYRIDSPRWREMQRELADAEAALRLAQAAADSIDPLLEAHEAHHAEIEKAVELWSARVEALERLRAAGGARGDEVSAALASLAAARSDLAETLEKEAELDARRKVSAAALDAANMRLVFLHEAAATMTGLSAAELRALSPSGRNDEPRPRWATLDSIEVRSLAPGVIERLDVVSGGVVNEHAPVLSIVQPEQVRFRAVGLQSDLPRLTDGQPATVVPAQERVPGLRSDAHGGVVTGTLTIAPTADPERRTVDLILTPRTGTPLADGPSWVRAGVAAFLEIVTQGSGGEELAIPLRCIVRDGTQAIIFRRDPANPDKVIRMEADLGVDDGRWVVIQSGVAQGNEVVLDGAYQLMVATSGNITRGGHFHADGTFHEGDD